MSHTTKTQAGIHSEEALKRAVKRIPGAEYKGEGTCRHHSGTVRGHLVRLPGYKFDVAVNLKSGEILADTYEGTWGDDALQGKLAQASAVEAGKMEAERQGHTFKEILLESGAIKCTITMGGGAPTLGENPNALGGTSAPAL